MYVLVNMLNAQESSLKVLNQCKVCVQNYDECLSDLFQGLGSMDGDDITNCQSSRDECLDKIEKKAKK